MDELENNDDMLNKIENILKDSYHPDLEDLGNYILYKNGIEPENKSIIKIVPKIELHLRKCNECNRLFLELNNEYSELDSFLLEKLPSETKKIPESEKVQIIQPVNYFKFSGIVLALACLLIFSIFSVSQILTPASAKYANLKNISGLYETRGRVSYDFQESLKAFENQDYENTVNWLKKDIINNSSDESIFYSHYILGLAFLESARKDVFGLFPSYDKTKVNDGILALNEAMNLNSSGKFPNINLDICFYLAKADLMLDNIAQAKINLKIVITEKGSYMDEAKNILSGLN
jgi:hypothetical protein